MDDNAAVTIWLVSILAILIASGFYRIWQGELRTPALLQQINDLQHQNAYLQAENTRLSPQSDDPPAPPLARGWFQRLLWGPESAPNANVVQQQNISLLRRIGIIRQQFDTLRQHNGNLEQQNDKLRNELGNGAALNSDDLDQLRDWFVDRIVELKEGIKERDERLHALGEENENFRTENDDLHTTHNNEIARDERIRHLEEENRILRDMEGGEVSSTVLTQLETVLDQTRKSNSDLRAQLNTANQEFARLGDQLKGPETNAKTAAENIAHFEAENNALKTERDTAQTYLNTANEGKTNLEHQLEDVLARLKTAEDKNKYVEMGKDKLKEANKNYDEIPAQQETSQSHGKTTTADITRLLSEVQKLTAGNTKLATQLETAEAQLKEATDDAAKLKLQLADCFAAKVKSNATIKSLTDADEGNGRLNDDLNEANVKIKDLKTRLELMTTAWEEALSRITHVEEQAKQKDSEQLAQLKADYAKAVAESQEKSNDLEELQTGYDQLDEHFAAQIQDLAMETAAHRQCSEEINRLNDLIQATIKTAYTAPVDSTKSPLTRSIISTASTSPIKPSVVKLELSTLATTDTTPIEPTNLSARVGELESQIQTTTEERDTARKDLDQERLDRSGDAEDCTSEKNQLRTAQETSEVQLQQAQTRVTDLEGELRAAKEERNASASSDAEAKKEDLNSIANLESNLEDTRKELETERRLKEELQQAQQNCQEISNDWRRLSAEHDPYPGDEHTLEREGCKCKIQRLEDEISHLRCEEMIQDEEIFELKVENNQAQETILEKTMEIERLEMELEELKNAEARLRKAIREIKRLNEELGRAQLQIPATPGEKTEEESVECPKCHLEFPGKSQDWLENEHIPNCNPMKDQDAGPDDESRTHKQPPREEEPPSDGESLNKEAPLSGGEPAQQEQPQTGLGTHASAHPTNETTRVPEPTSSPLKQAPNVEKLGDVGENQQPSTTHTTTQPPTVIQLLVAAKEDANANPGPHDLVCEPGCGYRIRALVAKSIDQMNRHQQGCPDYQEEVQRAEKEAEQNPSGITCDNCNQFWPRDLVSFNEEHVGGRNPCTPDKPHEWQPYAGVNEPPDTRCDLCKEMFLGKTRAWLKNEHWPECARKYQEEHGEANRKRRKLGNPVTCDNCGHVYYVGRHTSMNGFHNNHNDQCRKENPRKNGNVKGKSRYEKIKCEHCGTQFSREEMFKDRIGHAYNCLMVPKPSEGKCRHCGAEFKSKDQLVTQHVQAGKCPKKPKKVKCISCREEFAGQTDEWLKTVHLPKCPGRILQSEDDRTCKNCKYVFLSKNDMFRHLGIGNSEPKQVPECRKYKHVPPPKSWGAQPPARTLTPTSPGPSQQGFGGRRTTTNNNAQNTGPAQPKPSSRPTGGFIGSSQYAPSDASRSETATQSQVMQNTQQPPTAQTDPQSPPPGTPLRNSTPNPDIGTQEQSTLEPPSTGTQTQTPIIGTALKATTLNPSTGAQAQKVPQASSQPKPAEKTGGLMGKSKWASDGAGAGTNTTPRTGDAQDNRQDKGDAGGGQISHQGSSGSRGLGRNTQRPPTTDAVKCTYCSSKNHTEASCRKKESDRKCPYCRQTDHNEVDKCPFKKSDEKKGKLRRKCGYCRLWGHNEDVCTKKEKDTAFAACRSGNIQAGNNRTGSGRGSGRAGNNPSTTLPARGSIISYGSGTTNTGTGTAPQITGTGTATNAHVGARDTEQAGTSQLRLDPKYDAKANRWADMENDSEH